MPGRGDSSGMPSERGRSCQEGPANQEDKSRVPCSFQTGSRASNAKAMEKVAEEAEHEAHMQVLDCRSGNCEPPSSMEREAWRRRKWRVLGLPPDKRRKRRKKKLPKVSLPALLAPETWTLFSTFPSSLAVRSCVWVFLAVRHWIHVHASVLEASGLRLGFQRGGGPRFRDRFGH